MNITSIYGLRDTSCPFANINWLKLWWSTWSCLSSCFHNYEYRAFILAICPPYDKAFKLMLFLDPCDLDLGGHAQCCDEVLPLESTSYWGQIVSQTHLALDVAIVFWLFKINCLTYIVNKINIL